jgi:hypothetical protein
VQTSIEARRRRVTKNCRGNGNHSFRGVLLFMGLTFSDRGKPQKSQLCHSSSHVFIEGASVQRLVYLSTYTSLMCGNRGGHSNIIVVRR